MSKNNNYVKIFDTTLRDGEQSPGASMSLSEKIQIAEIFDTMGIDIIEAGFPIASEGDFDAVSEVSKIVKNVQVCGLARAGQKDVDRAGAAVKHAVNPRIHTFIATSPIHMKFKLQMDEDQVLEAINDSVSRARNLVEDVQWSAEDATRTDRDFLFKCVDTAISSGASTINIPDTVGYTTPEEYFEIIDSLMNNIPSADKVTFSTHCHNDLGLAVANSLSGVRAGARQVECTMNGIGERAGNAALEELVMSMKVRKDILNYDSNVDTTLFTRASKLVSSITSFPVQFNKAIVGKNAFAHESGIHQDGMLKNNETYEIMTPESIGLSESTLVMGKHSGRHAFKEKAFELGYELADNQLNDAFYRFKGLQTRRKKSLMMIL
jgi:2-isopropylmalate synthase